MNSSTKTAVTPPNRRVLVEMEKLKNPNSGLGQFCYHLGLQFESFKNKELKLYYYLPKSKLDFFGTPVPAVKQCPLHKVLPMKAEVYDVWHCLHQDSAYLPAHSKTKVIVTIHDLNFLQKYKGIRRTLKLRKLQKKVDRAQAITVISKFTEQMVKKHLSTGTKPILVIPNGNPLIPLQNPKKPEFVHFEKFIFTIGIISQKKNFISLLPLLEKNPDLHLVIAGDDQGSYANDLFEMVEKLNLKDRLHLPGPVNNEQKNWLYQNCMAFVFPSLTEGFGLPVVEAMSLGKPVFLSKLTSLPEIGGPEAFYWESFDPDSMNRIFQEGLRNFDSQRAQRSIEWAKRFSWESAAQAYLELYSRI